eukprot:g11646.t1
METPLKIDSGVEEDVDSALIEPRTTLLSKEEVLQQDLENDGFGPDDDRTVVKNVHDDVAEWIQEYFQFQGYSMTLECFQAEFLSKKYAVNVENAVNNTDFDGIASNRKRKIEKIMKYFEEGNAESFTNEWNNNIPLHVREAETSARKTFFMAQVYFLVCAFKDSQAALNSGKTFSPRKTKASPRLARSPSKRQMRTPALQTALDRFRVYLEDDGGDITSIEPTLAKFHALMYVSNPNRNADFQHMFDEGTSKKWVADVKKSITDVLESVLENVPLPRLLQMYESFMTSYKGFDEQLKNQQEMALDMQRIAKRLFQLSVKVARDASAMINVKHTKGSNIDENTDSTQPKVPSDSNAEIINSDYVFRVRQTLRECREDLKGASLRRKRKTPKDMNAAFAKKLPPFLMGQPPPLDYSKVREGMSLAGDSTAQLMDSLWWRLVYSSPPAMGHVITKEKFKVLQSEMRHNVARDVLDGDIFWIVRQEEGRESDTLIRECLALNPSQRPLEMAEHAFLRAGCLRIIDAFSSWREGRNYLKRLSKEVPFLIIDLVSNDILKSEGTPALPLSASSDVEEGVVRRGMALLLNLLTESKTFDVLEGNEDKIVEQILEACCLTMESSTLKGKAADRSGRRYASAAMYGMMSQSSCCKKAKAYDARIKTMISKHALVRSDRFFVHELECISQRINGEENEAPARPRPPKEDPENEQDQYESDSEDYIGEYGALEATPVQDALTRSETLLRSAEYSFKEKIVPGDNQAIRSILDAVEDDTEEAHSSLSALNDTIGKDSDDVV